MSAEPLYLPRYSNIPSSRYNPISLGQPATAGCPTRSLWWLVIAAGVGSIVGWKMAEGGRRKGRR